MEYVLPLDVFKRHMHKLTEGVSGTEVVADDFIVAGFGDTLKEAFLAHKKPCRLSSKMFPMRCQAYNGKTLALLRTGPFD